jgi:hypothetical protein
VQAEVAQITDFSKLSGKQLRLLSRGDDLGSRLGAIAELERRRTQSVELTPGEFWTRVGVVVAVLAIIVGAAITVFLPEIRKMWGLAYAKSESRTHL